MFSLPKKSPTIFHITHQKAGSQWIFYVFKLLIPDRIVEPKVHHEQFLEEPIIEGGFYPTIYLAKEEFDSVKIPGNHRKFVVIRDLRDTLVSFYFSMRYSHPVINKFIQKMRDTLTSMSKEEGLIFLMKRFQEHHAVIQDSWVHSDELIYKYEDLIENETKYFLEIFKHCEIQAPKKKLLKAISENSFKKRSAGRKLGQENLKHHLRKGIPGDWKNHFTDPVKKKFKEKFGNLLIKTGYEADLNW